MTPYTRSTLPEAWLLARILFAALLALGIVVYVLEGFFPPLVPVPGAKLGLSNIVVLFAMLFLGYGSGILLAIARSILGSFLAGTLFSPGALLSLAGGLVSALVVAFSLKRLRPPLGLVGSAFSERLLTTSLSLSWRTFSSCKSRDSFTICRLC
jgi:uncharacterized membrane protein